MLYITSTDKVYVENSKIYKELGDSSNIENSEFYGVNAAILVQGGNYEMKGGEIKSKVKGGNALVATNDATVKIRDTKIESTGERSLEDCILLMEEIYMEHKIEGLQYKNADMQDFSLNIMQITLVNSKKEEHTGNSMHERDIAVSDYFE